MKVFVADGTRFITNTSSTPITYSGYTNGNKGIMSGSPPSTYDPSDYRLHREYSMETSKRVSYRHGGKNRINAAFFDGHGEGMLVDNSQDRFTGKAIEPRWYYPTGSTVISRDRLHKNTIQNGLTLP